jgi:hypothetical protein
LIHWPVSSATRTPWICVRGEAEANGGQTNADLANSRLGVVTGAKWCKLDIIHKRFPFWAKSSWWQVGFQGCPGALCNMTNIGALSNGALTITSDFSKAPGSVVSIPDLATVMASHSFLYDRLGFSTFCGIGCVESRLLASV